MPFSFPASPTVGQTSTQNGRQYVYAGSNTWELVAASGGGGGSSSLVTAASVSAFPGTGSASNLYITTEDQRLWRWDSTASIYVESGPIGGGFAFASVPASATASGTTGQVATDGAYWYYCSAPNTWVRASLSTWSSFTPASVTGLQAWYDASDASTLYDATSGGSLVAADGAVARWEDKSGNGRHATQSTSGNRPLRKAAIQAGKSVLRFDGSNDSLPVDSVASTLSGDDTAFTMFVVAKNTGSNADRVVFSAGSSSTANPMRELALASDQLSYFRRDDSNSSSGGANASTRTTGFGVIGVVQQATSHTMYLNGASVHSASANIGSVTANRATVGCLGRTSDAAFFDGDIAEIIIYNAALSDTDRASLESHLMTKWAIS